MPGSVTSVFSEPQDFEAVLREDGVLGMLIIGRGRFRARLTQITLHRLRLSAAEEHLPRIAFVAVPADTVLVLQPIGGGLRRSGAGSRCARARSSLSARTSVCMHEATALPLGHHPGAGVRLRVFRLKFGLKVLVSRLRSVGVFAPLFVGGIMVLHGKTEIGIVVAFISGLDRVLDPWRELIAFVRSTSAAKVQFDLIEGTLGRKL